MPEPLLIAKSASLDLAMLPALANRHGCITGATGTGTAISRGLVRGLLGSLLGGKRR